MSSFYENPTERGIVARIIGYTVLAVIVVGIISAALWGAGVLFAGPKGQGEAYKQKESAVNRIEKQEMFVQLNEDFQGFIAKIEVAKQAYQRDPSDVNSTNLTGVTQICIDTAQQYNAESQKYTSRDFKSAGLPYRLDPADCR
jgi:Rieske Fe-S protein